jgi:tetratricopeptide (TPR) repeat protein
VSSSATDGKGVTSVSVAAYKAPAKARDALRKAQEASIKGKNDEAQKQIAKALEIYPKYADALTLRAILKMDVRDLQSATADLQEAINDDENCPLAYMVMGAVLNMEGKFDDAIRALTRGESLSPNSWQAYLEMGKALMGKAQYEAALREFDRAQNLAPDASLIHLAKARAMFGLKNYSDAILELQAYLAKEPQSPRSEEARKMLAEAQTHAAAAEK